MEELKHLVEAHRVAAARRADREQLLKVARNQAARQQALARAHPVAVALDRVDLAVVCDVAVRMRKRPARECVRREPGVHEGERRGESGVGHVREERLQLWRREHALVDDRSCGQRREVHFDFALDPLACAKDHALQRHAGKRWVVRRDEQLPEARHHGPRARTRNIRDDGNLAPAEHAKVFVSDDALDAGDRDAGGRARRGAGRRCRRRRRPTQAAKSRRHHERTRPGSG